MITVEIENPHPAPVARFYTSFNKYLLPVDSPEEARLKDQHELLLRLFDERLVFAPLKLGPETEVLDIATGSGIWALGLVQEHPSIGKIYCTDIGATLFPKTAPPNTTFTIGSVLDLPTTWDNKFDLVHQRLLIAALKYEEWAIAIGNIFRVTKPGGYAELCELNPLETGCGPYSWRYIEAHRKIMTHFGVDWDIANRLPIMLQEAGFVDIRAEVRTARFGPAGGEDGRRLMLTQVGVARGLGGPLMKAGGLGVVDSQDEWDAFIDDVQQEWESEAGSDAIYPWFIITARKPE